MIPSVSIAKKKGFIDIGFDKYQCNELFPNQS